MLNPDFKDMLSAFNAEGVEFLIVGGYALAGHGLPRATGDLDFWVRRSPANAARIYRALLAFGAPLDAVSEEDFLAEHLVFQMGVEPSRIDILTSVDALHFEEAWPNRVPIEVDGVPVPLLGLRDLLTNKRATGRDQDLADVARIEARLQRDSTPEADCRPPLT